MNEDEFVGRQRPAEGSAKQARSVPYTAKDFQLEVLGQLSELQTLTAALHDQLANEVSKDQQNRLLKFDGRTLVAIGAIALSLTGYVLQDARNTSKRDADIETTKARVTTLEGVAAANTAGRIRTEVELGELRGGLTELRTVSEARAAAGKKTAVKK